MVFRVRVTGLKEVQKMVQSLPKHMEEEVRNKGIPRITRLLQSRIKRSFTMKGYGKGPSSTGASLKAITYHKTKRGAVVEITAPWLKLIEKGQTSSHWVSSFTIEKHRRSPGSTVFQRAPLSQAKKGDPVWWRYKGPFVQPAVKRFRPKIVPHLEKDVARAISKSLK